MMADEADDVTELPLTYDHDSSLEKHFAKFDHVFEPKFCGATQENIETGVDSDLIRQDQQRCQEGGGSIIRHTRQSTRKRKLLESKEASKEKLASLEPKETQHENKPAARYAHFPIPIAPRPSNSSSNNDMSSQGNTKVSAKKGGKRGIKRGQYKCTLCGALKANHECKNPLEYTCQHEERISKRVGPKEDEERFTEDDVKNGMDKISMKGALRILNVTKKKKNDDSDSSSSSDAGIVEV